MKLKINQKDLKEGFDKVCKCTGKGNNIYILSGILMVAKNNQLCLKSTNLEYGMQVFLDCDIDIEGEVVIPGKEIHQFISKLPDSDIYIVKEKDKLKINNNNSKFVTECWNVKEFPEFKKVNKQEVLFDQKQLKDMFNKVAFAASKNDNNKPQLNGIKLLIENKKIDVAATNTYRLSCYSDDIDLDKNVDLIVPVKSIDVLVSLLEEGEVKIVFDNSFIEFNFNNISFQSRLISGEYPNYKQIIPENDDVSIKINVEQFKKSLERVLIVSEDIELSVVDKKINITNYDSGIDINEVIECETEGNQLKIIFDGNYLLDSIKNIKTISMNIYGKDELSPLLIKEENNNKWKYIIMPIRRV